MCSSAPWFLGDSKRFWTWHPCYIIYSPVVNQKNWINQRLSWFTTTKFQDSVSNLVDPEKCLANTHFTYRCTRKALGTRITIKPSSSLQNKLITQTLKWSAETLTTYAPSWFAGTCKFSTSFFLCGVMKANIF